MLIEEVPEVLKCQNYFDFKKAWRQNDLTEIEYMIFSLLRTEVYFTLQKKKSETVFNIKSDLLAELTTYNFNRRKKTLKITNSELIQGLNSLKRKHFLKSVKLNGDCIQYKLHNNLYRIFSQEREFIWSVIKPVTVGYRGRPFVRVFQELMLRSADKKGLFKGMIIYVGDFFAGRTTVARILGMNFNDFTTSMQVAQNCKLIETAGEIRRKTAKGFTSYNKYRLVCRFKDKQDLFSLFNQGGIK